MSAAAMALVIVVSGFVWAQNGPAAHPRDDGPQILAVARQFGPFQLAPAPAPGGYTLVLMEDTGTRRGSLDLQPPWPGAGRPRVRSQHFGYTISNFTAEIGVTEQLIRAARALVRWDGGALPEQPVQARLPQVDDLLLPADVVLGLAIVAGWWRRWNIKTDLRLIHVVQMVTQGSIFLYWSLYWPAVRQQMPQIGLMLLMGFASDALFSLVRFGSWRAGFSVVPVVLSINLFEWFDVRGAVVSVVAAFACKHLVHRGGRHIFNPSVAGLTVTGLITLIAPQWIHFGGLFHTLSVAPNMAEWIMVVTLLPQLRFRILPVSLGAFLALTWWHIPGVLRPTIVIAMTLLATDPATSPVTDVGKLLFGLTFGASLPLVSIALRRHGDPDDFAKILAIPVANLLVPQMDSVARFIARVVAGAWDRVSSVVADLARVDAAVVAQWTVRVRRPVPNVLVLAVWLSCIVPRLAAEKPDYFEPTIHWNQGTPMVVRGADDVPRCQDNPVFCRAFTFREEARWWLRRLNRTGREAGSRMPAVHQVLRDEQRPVGDGNQREHRLERPG